MKDIVNDFGKLLQAETDEIIQQKMIWDFATEHNFVIISLDRAWVELSTARRYVWDLTNSFYMDYPKLTDQDFVNKSFKRFIKRNMVYIQRSIWGLEKITFYY